MRVRLVLALTIVAALAIVGGLGASTAPASVKRCHPRRHHPCPKPLPRRLEVDENDQGELPKPYSLIPSHNPVGAGTVEFNVYNFGQDPHTFAVIDSRHRRRVLVQVPANQPDTAVPVHLRLAAGTYTLECTLSGHAHLGMRATLRVK